ncbi:uncharacterized protein LOC130647261 isoform X1 [Hydractinia symbiolongicarpus]|uniref:uncharacterized protein LOC130647261 isoform X1 n=2 Tax=Hydractinia symbiolongicarpus TaxID=13093 RepID=UPI00254F4F26|nr:uncharacterized protein LOC130647261 isoform X1 [Hydractinia symbiolongicarpus]
MVRVTKPFTTQFNDADDVVKPQVCLSNMKIDSAAKSPKNGLKFEGIPLKIQNIDDEINEETLIQKFSKFGNVLKTEMVSDERVRNRRHAILYFQSPGEAAKAIAWMNGSVILSKKISVTLASPRTKSRRPSTPSMQRFGSLAFTGQQQTRSQCGRSEILISPHISHSWAARSIRHSSSSSSIKSLHKPLHKTNSQ